MNKKAIILGLFVVLLAPSVGGVFSATAQADYIYNGIYCTPSVQSVGSGDLVSFSAGYTYPTFQAGNFTWTAVGGHPSSGTGLAFSTRFYTASINETRVITVTDGYQSADCTVIVYGSTPTPPPWPSDLNCSPSYTTANSGERVRFSATGGNGYNYQWSAPEGSPSNGDGSSFSTRFYNDTGMVQDYWVTVSSNLLYKPYNWQTDSCQVRIYPAYTTPTPTPVPSFSLTHSVRNVTNGNEGSSVEARNGDRLQFTTRIKMGNEYGEDVHIRDWLPQYTTYVYGSTTVDGVRYQDGIATGNPNDSLALGYLSPNRTYIVRFDATVSGAPRVTLTNSVNVQVRYAPVQNRTSTVKFIGGSVTPTPTPVPTWTPGPTPIPGTLVLSIAGRNITRGGTGEYTTVNARANNTVEFVLHVRSGSNLNNVYVTDYLPAGMTYIQNTTVLNGYIVADGITSTGLNIGSLGAGQEAVIRFSALVDGAWVPSHGVVTVTNTAQTRADGITAVSASMKVTFGQVPVASASGVQTGPADSLLIALAIAALTTGIYAGYTRTGSFGRRMAAAEIERMRGTTPNFLG